MQPSDRPPTRNLILNSLPTDVLGRIGPQLKYLELDLGAVLLNAGDPLDFLFFPDTGMASIMGRSVDGESAEIGVIGNEGAVGVEALLGAGRMANEATIQMPGGGSRLPASAARREFELGGHFQREMLEFVHRLLVQVSRTATCNALHSVDERLARWLLMCADRSPDGELRLTQEFMAVMVGATRPTVSIAAHGLQDAGAIAYSRGVVHIRDRSHLLAAACDCYTVMREQEHIALSEPRG